MRDDAARYQHHWCVVVPYRDGQVLGILPPSPLAGANGDLLITGPGEITSPAWTVSDARAEPKLGQYPHHLRSRDQSPH